MFFIQILQLLLEEQQEKCLQTVSELNKKSIYLFKHIILLLFLDRYMMELKYRKLEENKS